MVVGTDFGGVLRDLDDVIQHRPVLFVEGGGFIILAQGFSEAVIQGDSTQKLCVRNRSIKTPVGDGDGRGDHLLLPPGQRQIGRH